MSSVKILPRCSTLAQHVTAAALLADAVVTTSFGFNGTWNNSSNPVPAGAWPSSAWPGWSRAAVSSSAY
ncbi:hypothetical protein ABZ917_36915 [Nonomuraea wenchangensis]